MVAVLADVVLVDLADVDLVDLVAVDLVVLADADPEALVAAVDAQVAPVVVEAVIRLPICTRT